MQSALLHDPTQTATPSMRLANAARIERQRRIAQAAVATKPLAAPPPVVETAPDPTFKEPWFSIESEIESDEPRRPPIRLIQETVARHYGVTRADIISARRTNNVVIPRHVAMHLSRTMTLMSFPHIARKFGGRDHTVAMYASRKIAGLMSTAPEVAAAVELLTAKISEAVRR